MADARDAADTPPGAGPLAALWSRIRHGTRWEHLALLTVLLLLALLVGLRANVTGQLAEAARVALLVRRAEALEATQPVIAGRLWERLRTVRRDDIGFQALVWSKLLDLYAAGRDARLDQICRELPAQPAFTEGEPRLMWSYGSRLLAVGRAAEAVAPLRTGVWRAAELDDLGLNLRLSLARALEASGDLAAAEPLYLGLAEARPDEAWLGVELARHWADRGLKLPRAKALALAGLTSLRHTAWQHGHRRPPADQEAHGLDVLGWVQYRLGEREAARVSLEAAQHLAMDRPEPLNLYHLAELYFDLGLDSDALGSVNKALERAPGLGAARLLRDRIVDAATRGRSST